MTSTHLRAATADHLIVQIYEVGTSALTRQQMDWGFLGAFYDQFEYNIQELPNYTASLGYYGNQG